MSADPDPLRPTRRASLLAGLTAPLALGSQAVEPGTEAANEWPPVRPTRTRFAVQLETWFTNLGFEERIIRSAEFGFRAFEFDDWQGRDMGRVARVSHEMSLAVARFSAWGPGRPPICDPAHHEAFEAGVRRACEIAGGLGARALSIVAGDAPPGSSPAGRRAAVLAACRRVVPIAEEAGVVLVLEPLNTRVDHPGHSLVGSEAGVSLCREVDSPALKLCWDLYHMQISEGDLCGHLEQGFDQLGHVQLADHPGRHEPGTGEIAFPRVLRQLFELGYQGFVGLDCSPRDDTETAARRVMAADAWE